MSECGVDGDSPSLEAADQDRSVAAHPIEDCKQVFHLRIRFVGVRGLAESAAVVGHRAILGGEPPQLSAPHAPIGDAGVQQYDRNAAAAALGGKSRAP